MNITKDKVLKVYLDLELLKKDNMSNELGENMAYAFLMMILGSKIIKKGCKKEELQTYFERFFANDYTPHDISAFPANKVWSKLITKSLIDNILKYMKNKRIVSIDNGVIIMTRAGVEIYQQLEYFIGNMVV